MIAKANVKSTRLIMTKSEVTQIFGDVIFELSAKRLIGLHVGDGKLFRVHRG
jgi:uncharacterized protein YrrD